MTLMAASCPVLTCRPWRHKERGRMRTEVKDTSSISRQSATYRSSAEHTADGESTHGFPGAGFIGARGDSGMKTQGNNSFTQVVRPQHGVERL